LPKVGPTLLGSLNVDEPGLLAGKRVMSGKKKTPPEHPREQASRPGRLPEGGETRSAPPRTFVTRLAAADGSGRVTAVIDPVPEPSSYLATQEGIVFGDRVLDLVSDLLVDLIREDERERPAANADSPGPTPSPSEGGSKRELGASRRKQQRHEP
jgi:hypothetical protein